MILLNKKAVKVGDCECCIESVNVELFPSSIDATMLMCKSCKDKEDNLPTKVMAPKQVIEFSQKIDTSITLDTDIYNAQTVSQIQLKAAIDNDETIPPQDKEYRYAKETETRLLHLQKVIFESKIAERVLQAELHQSVARQDDKRKAEFKNRDINYVPKPITKREKSTGPVVKSGKKFDKVALRAACQKYGVPENNVQAIYVKNANITYDEAAKKLAKILGLID